MAYLLIFDDNPKEWQRLSRALDGYKIIRIDHSKPLDKCIRLFNPKVVLLNLCLARSNTWEIFQELRIEYPDLPILTYTAKDHSSLQGIKEAVENILCSCSSLPRNAVPLKLMGADL